MGESLGNGLAPSRVPFTVGLRGFFFLGFGCMDVW